MFVAPRRIVSARHLLLVFACGAVILLGARLSVFAQPVTPVHRIATLGADTTQVWDVFHRRLKELGYVEGENLILEHRWSHGYGDRVPTLLAELLRTKPDVLVTSMLPPTSRIEAEQCVPILAIAVWEPYGSCRTVPVARMSQASSAREVSANHLRLARAAVPGASRFLVLTNSERPFLVEYVRWLESSAATEGVTLHVLDAGIDPDIGNLAAAITREAPDLLIVAPSFLRPDARRQIVRFATARGIPSIGSYVADGVLIAADYDWTALALRAADFVDQLLKGATPLELSTGAPPRLEIIVDRRVAKILGLTIPESVLAQADRVLN